MHLVDHARKHIEETFARPPADRLLRQLLARVLPSPLVFRLALLGAKAAGPFARLLPAQGPLGRIRAMLGLAPARIPAPSPVDTPQVFPAEGERRTRMALLSGCAQQVLAPEINEATIRLLTRHGVEVVVARGAGCCGALTHHMGKERPALRSARRNIDAWTRELSGEGLDAVVINASGCGTTVKDYGFMLRDDPRYADKAARVSAITRDVTEVMSELGLMPAVVDTDLVVAYHSACSMQHGQRITKAPKALLGQAGFTVRDVPEGHLCCGSAGTYNILQPEIATRLRDRKIANIERLQPDLIATGNIGCMTQIAAGTTIPMAHTAALLDWATGGPIPDALQER
jgi:glycolate oxidase iron-sulfur subunit